MLGSDGPKKYANAFSQNRENELARVMREFYLYSLQEPSCRRWLPRYLTTVLPLLAYRSCK